MSSQDTDLIELAVGTLVALDKLTKKMHLRRQQLDLLASRIQWDLCRKKCWQTFSPLASDVAAFVENKARWSTSIYHSKATTTDANGTRSSTKAHRSARQLTEDMRREATQLNDRVRLFCTKLVPDCSERLDQLIEQCQVPESFLDEQDRIDDLGSVLKVRGKVLLEVAAQWVRIDELFRTLHTLHLDAKELASTVKASDLDSDDRSSFSRRLSKLVSYLERLCGPSTTEAFLSEGSVSSRSLMRSMEHHIPQPKCKDYPFLDSHNEEVKKAIGKELGAAANHIRTVNNLCRKDDDHGARLPSQSSDQADASSEATHSRTTSLISNNEEGSSPSGMPKGTSAEDDDVFGSHTRLPSYSPVETRRSDVNHSPAKERILALTTQCSTGHIEEQTEIDGLRQLQSLLPLPTQGQADEVARVWKADKEAAEAFLSLETSEGLAKDVAALRDAMRKRDSRLLRFRLLAAFVTRCEHVQTSQSSLLNLLDRLQGITSSAYDTNEDSEQGKAVTVEGRETPTCRSHKEEDKARITKELLDLSNLVEAASAAADPVSQDKRVRDELAKVRRSTKDLTAMAREILAPPGLQLAVSEDEARESSSSAPSTATSIAPSSESESESEANGVATLRVDNHESLTPLQIQPPCSNKIGREHPAGLQLTPRKAADASVRISTRSFSEGTPRAFPQSPLVTPRQSRVRQKSTRSSPHQSSSRIPVLSPSKSASSILPSGGRTPSQRHPNRYRANPKSKLDVAVSKVVNHLPIPVQVSHASGEWRDESGRYWVGSKLCFCRILRSRTVMVRVGGGWQELSSYIGQHYAHLGCNTSIAITESPKGQFRGPTDEDKLPWISSATISPKASPSTSPAAMSFLRSATDADLQRSPLLRKKTSSFSSTLSSTSPLRPRRVSAATPTSPFSRKASDGIMPSLDLFSSPLLPSWPSTPASEAKDHSLWVRRDGSGADSSVALSKASTPRSRTSSRVSPPTLKVWRP